MSVWWNSASKIVCVGRNWIAHANELSNPVPKAPFFFLKPTTALISQPGPIILPSRSEVYHYEGM